MMLAQINLEGKSYEIKHTMTVKEYKQVMHLLKISTDIQIAIKDSKETDITKYVTDLNMITVQDYDILEQIVMRCCEMSKETLEEMEYADVIFLFSEIMNLSRTPKKKLLKESSSESTTPQTQHS